MPPDGQARSLTNRLDRNLGLARIDVPAALPPAIDGVIDVLAVELADSKEPDQL